MVVLRKIKMVLIERRANRERKALSVNVFIDEGDAPCRSLHSSRLSSSGSGTISKFSYRRRLAIYYNDE